MADFTSPFAFDLDAEYQVSWFDRDGYHQEQFKTQPEAICWTQVLRLTEAKRIAVCEIFNHTC